MQFKSLLILSTLTLSSYTAKVWAQESVSTNAFLNNVTVYKLGAELKHTAKVNLPQGSTELIINDVAANIDENSIQVNAPGNITIMSVMLAKNYKPKANTETPEYQKKAAEIKETEQALQKVSNKREAYERTLGMLARNEEIKGMNTGMSVSELGKMAEYYLTKQIELKDQISALKLQEQDQVAAIQKYKTQLGEVNGQGVNTGGQLILQVMTNAPALNNSINISYISQNAGWAAAYDLKAEKTSDPVKIMYKANVMQNTGLDWKKVKLTLSTGNPTVGSNAPLLSTWFLRYGAVAAQYKNQATYNTIQSFDQKYNASSSQVSAYEISQKPTMNLAEVVNGSSSGIALRGQSTLASTPPLIILDGVPYNGALTDINPLDVKEMTVLKDANALAVYGSRAANGVTLITTKGKGVSDYTDVAEKELNTTFDIDIPYSIASNNKPHSVLLQELKVPASYKYYAVPKLDPDAFLLAEVTQYEQLNLIPGEANIIFENTYVGKTFLNPYNTQDTLNLSMGRDKRITIKREKIADLAGIKMMGSNRKQTFTYELTLKNSKKEAIDMLLKDQYPIGTDNNMEIELLSSDNAAVNKETGVLTWKLKINPGETKKVRFSYSVKYPKDQYIGNL
ncbi:hypothetical protein DBR32_03455 [Taibaiella sp. KBW10]|uniref:DUF4139 domain-containing protein n=1 Tax=Taibaiella sp. KBW10 TaxID=2153357 RepID=UPI000F5A0B8B|nr:DUF4139 domain-containing protein [Taibaiella sp. KBW10]RQO31874.1 hypothetical protein DBR32_03455 [Taibaiella sp. KBW10]